MKHPTPTRRGRGGRARRRARDAERAPRATWFPRRVVVTRRDRSSRDRHATITRSSCDRHAIVTRSSRDRHASVTRASRDRHASVTRHTHTHRRARYPRPSRATPQAERRARRAAVAVCRCVASAWRLFFLPSFLLLLPCGVCVLRGDDEGRGGPHVVSRACVTTRAAVVLLLPADDKKTGRARPAAGARVAEALPRDPRDAQGEQ